MEDRDRVPSPTARASAVSEGHTHDERKDCPDESTHTEQRGITQVVRNIFGGGTRAQDTILAIAIVVIILQTVLLLEAWKDLQTQVWLRSDSLTKENAQLLAEIRTTQGLVQAYGISKTIQDSQEKRK